ncbi:MAG: sodium:solute symporter [Saprospiraceae bacterium]|nr:sodium:solute symporter [Saprospiraceae bacterium]
MHWIDWTILLLTLLGITAYGVWTTRRATDMNTYLSGAKELKWWTIGLSIMATQASAITFLSTTGQGYEDGMRFAQFYFGLPIAMVILSIFFLPIYYRLNVVTAYEYLEKRFDLRTRTFAAVIFLLQRGMGAGLTIYAPSIVLSVILGWDLKVTIFILSVFTIIYTVFGGGEAVSVTQQQQMIVILSGLVVAFFIMIYKLPSNVGFTDALTIAGKLGKTNVVDFTFDLGNRYTFWSGMLGGVFLFLSYFGTDQSQVQRYLSGKSLSESRLGLLFNGLIKVPMQFLVLFVGLMMFVFYQYNMPPIHFNPENMSRLQTPQYQNQLKDLQTKQTMIFETKRDEVNKLVEAAKSGDTEGVEITKFKIKDLTKEDKKLRDSVRSLVKMANQKAETNDRDYIFITFIINNLPIGIVGLLLAVIFSAAMSAKSSEINSLATTSVVDIYKRQMRPNETDAHYINVSKGLTAVWGFLAMLFALVASLLENLIEAINIIGSLFYGSVLGIFMVAFFMKKIGSKAVFWAAVLGELMVILLFLADKMAWQINGFSIKIAYLWLNLVGCILVMLLAFLFQQTIFRKQKAKSVTY